MPPPVSILIADDDPMIVDILVEVLQSQGYTVSTTHNGRACLRQAVKIKPDLILLDVMLPDMNGVDVCRQIKTNPRLARCFVILMSGTRTASDDVVTGLGVADEYIAKPWVMTELLARISTISRIQQTQRTLIDSQELERRRVARDLHDSVNQLIASVRFRIHSVVPALSKSPALQQQLTAAVDLLASALDEVRRISQDLRPSELEDIGLFAALRTISAGFEGRTGIAVSVFLPSGRQRPDPEMELTLYRMVQEALNNIDKHAKASSVMLSLTQRKSAWELIIEDDGIGFHPRKSQPGSGAGIKGLVERAAIAGGHCNIESEPSLGTRITIRLPLESGTQLAAKQERNGTASMENSR